MTPVLQSNFAPITGDCFAACVASVMDLQLSEVPNFMAKDGNADLTWSQAQWDAVKSFASERGYDAFWLDPDIPEDVGFIAQLQSSDLNYIATGRRSRFTTFHHNVVFHRGVLIHDPMGPDGVGICGDPILFIGFQKKQSNRIPGF